MPNQNFDNTNTGTIFINKDKKKLSSERDTSNWPSGQGKLNVYGIEFYISSWRKEIGKGDMKGEKFSSISIKPVDEAQGNKLEKLIKEELMGAPKKASGNKKSVVIDDEEFNDMDDDLPF